MKMDIDIAGLQEVQRKLMRLGDEKRLKKSARSSLRKGAAPVRKSAREGAKRLDDPKTAEMIYKNVTIRGGGARGERRVGGAMVRVGILGGARDMSKYGEFKGGGKANPGGDTWYWRFLEFGTSQHAARPFMRPALASNTGESTDLFVQDFNLQITRILNDVS